MDNLHSSMDINHWISSLDRKGKKICYRPGNSKKNQENECCMCGDVGFQELLFKCHKCYHRFQHLYCSRLYSDQLDLERVNVCDWCLDFQAKGKIESHKRKVESKELESKEAKMVADCEIVSSSASGIAMKQLASVTRKKPGKANAKSGNPKLHVKFCRSGKNQFERRTNNQASTQRSTSKGGFRRRYKLLSDMQCS